MSHIPSDTNTADCHSREDAYRLLFDISPVPMIVVDQETFQFLDANDAATKLFGYGHEELMKTTVLEICAFQDRARFSASVKEIANWTNDKIWRCQRADGIVIDVSISVERLTYAGRSAWLGVVHDVAERRRTEEQLRRTQNFLDMVIENVPVPLLVKEVPGAETDPSEFRYSLINRACEEMFGVSRDHVVGKTVAEAYSPERARFIIAENKKALASEESVTIQDHEVLTPNNGLRYATAKTFAVRDEKHQPQYLLTVIEDVTERRRTEERIARMARRDTLTELPNRMAFHEALRAAIEDSRDKAFAVLLIDLDGFKAVNDTYGHTVGDAVLRETACRLQSAAANAFVSRLGGDEFAFIISDEPQPEGAKNLASRVLKVLATEVVIEQCRVQLGCSLGAAIYPQHGVEPETLLINADIALYRAKAGARGALMLYSTEMGDLVRERHSLQADLAVAIERGELALYYQPQKSIAGAMVGFEALLRWHRGRRAIVPPAVFIPIAEESGLINSIDEWALREACGTAALWPQCMTVGVNMSPIQFRRRDLVATVQSILCQTHLSPDRLEIEITEGVLIDDFSRALTVLHQLKRLGVRIAIDDFGSGYSSLSYLHAFPFDKIKVDRAFVTDLEGSAHSRAILRAILDLGHRLKVPVLAEGVETEGQHRLLTHYGCDQLQGYFTGRPQPIEAYADCLIDECSNVRMFSREAAP